ncbi:serine hydrolase domain-containing protein [Algivirga pacifica]|uniref:Beta-lactamase-related domain-containing protein n=1 Tax=Algivirga pacifica TaxID=1162670 RepID=A0ABP9CZZ8_9BACT
MRHLLTTLLVFAGTFIPTGCNYYDAVQHAVATSFNHGPYDSSASHTTAEDSLLLVKEHQLDSIFQRMHSHRGFNGTVLVAQKGDILYQEAFGYKNFRSREKMDKDAIFQLASVSKQFTAAAIMLLKQRGMLKYSDKVTSLLPGFPYSEEITVKHLLTHRSGLPNYVYLAEEKIKDKDNPVNNQEMLKLFFEEKPSIYGQPDGKFYYNNTNYFLLACIVEKISGISFSDFMQKEFFEPLEMQNTFVWNEEQIQKHADQMTTGYSGRRKTFNPYFIDSVTGDKSVYSCTEDMFKWDMSLYSHTILNKETLEEAFNDSILETKRDRNYGFGYRLHHISDGSTVVFHGGWWRGYATLFVHYPKNQTTLIVLSNYLNKSYVNLNSVLDLLEIPEFKRV